MWVTHHVGNYCPVSVALLLKSRESLLEERLPHLITVMCATEVLRKECQQCPQMCKGSVGTVVRQKEGTCCSQSRAWQEGRWMEGLAEEHVGRVVLLWEERQRKMDRTAGSSGDLGKWRALTCLLL